jgi:hypothetical protein
MSNNLQRSDTGFSGFLKSLTMSSTDRANAMNRSVAEYRPCEIDAFFEPSRGVYNALISGGNPRIRVNAMVAQALSAVQNGFPVIVLHEGNRFLEQQLRTNLAPTGKYCEVSPSSPGFEPFYGLDILEISNQILESSPKEYDIKYNARYYIEGMGMYLQKNRKNPSFRMLSTCPHALIFDKIDDLQMRGIISDPEAQEIKSKLMMGQSENYKLDSFLASMKMEISPIMYQNRNARPVNIISALRNDQVLCFDVVSMSNKILLNTLMYQLKLAQTRGLQYTIIIDSLPLNANEAYANYVKSPSDKNCRMFSSDDFYSMVGGDEKVFSAIIGGTHILVVMAHTSGHTATRWAEVFGQYDKYEQSYSTSRGSSRATPFSIFSSPNRNQTVSVSKNREYIVKPESIARMGGNEAYILSAARGELAHLNLIG